MRDLIAERPNIVPTGLGNSESGIDIDIFGGGNNGEGNESTQSGNDDGLGDPTSDDDDRDDGGTRGTDSGPNEGGADSVASVRSKSAGKTAARPGTSKPVTRAPKESKKKRKLEEFVEIASAEELTRQKELDLARARAEEKKAKMEAKTAEMEYKTQKLAEKAARRKEKADEKAVKLRLFELSQHRIPSGYNHSPPFSSQPPFMPGSASLYPVNRPQVQTNPNSPLNPRFDFPGATAGSSTSYYRAGSVGSIGFPDTEQSADQSTAAFGHQGTSREGSLSYSNGDSSRRSESSPFDNILPSSGSFDGSFQPGQ
jgi:hypothetical protein